MVKPNAMTATNVAIIAGQLLVGGAERQLYLWLAKMDRTRFRPIVVTLHPDCGDYWEPLIESMDVPVLRVPRRANRLSRSLEIANVLKEFQPELIHAWHLFAGPYAGAAARLLGARACLGSLRGSFASVQRTRGQALLTMLSTQGMVVNSAAAGASLSSSYGWLCRNIHVVPNAVEERVEARETARRRLCDPWGLSPDNFWIGSMGRFEPLKRFDLLLDVTAALRKRGAKVNLLLIGYGPQLKELNAKAEALGISDSVVFTGADPEARTWLSALDTFCFLSVDEGLPNVIMEAAVAGVPIVSWRTPFLEELLQHQESAILVQQGDITALECAMLQLISDAALRNRLGESARRHVSQEFGIGRYIERMSGVYESMLQ
jgi:glycosyltransferase involved in cell wall biosynthesis